MGDYVPRTERPADGAVNIRAKEYRTSAKRAGGTYYAVFIGKSIQGRWSSKRATAEALAEKIKSSRRPCITCRDLFISEGAHNRMCPSCRRRHQGDAAW